VKIPHYIQTPFKCNTLLYIENKNIQDIASRSNCYDHMVWVYSSGSAIDKLIKHYEIRQPIVY